MAATVEDAARVDHHARGVHFSSHDALGFDLHSALSKNYAVESPSNDDAIAFDLPFDFGALAQNHCLFGYDVALDVSINAEGSFKLQRAFECYALVDEASPLFTTAAIL